LGIIVGGFADQVLIVPGDRESYTQVLMTPHFHIMNGAGNRFGIFDARGQADFALNPECVKKMAGPDSRIMGPKGADQIIVLRDPGTSGAHAFMEIWNREGFEVEACGNATRCSAWLYCGETGKTDMILETRAGLLKCSRIGKNRITVDMGSPRLEWDQVPLSEPMHTDYVDLKVGPIDDPVLSNPGAVGMGNPHCVFFVEDFQKVRPEQFGPMIECHPLFPEQVNVGFARIEAPDRIHLRVWERGVGMTLACGTGACAAVVAAVRQKRADRKATVVVDGGLLDMEWRQSDDHVIMTGPVELESPLQFSGNHQIL